jgi:metalloendopeptidase OMA1, mitochondrial
MLTRFQLTAVCLALVTVCSACSVNPYTQRMQLVLVSPSYEAKLGAAAYRKMLDENPVRTDPAAVIPVQRVMGRLIAAARQSKYADIARSFEWDISVIEDLHMRNAVALPGGKLLVYTGLFPVAQHEAGLAAVLSHEIVHALARHSVEQLTYDALRVTRDSARLPFSRNHELEADYIGLLLMAAAGYDPREAVGLWERMKASGDELPPEYLSSHPSYERRIGALQAHMPEAWEMYEQSGRGSSRF